MKNKGKVPIEKLQEESVLDKVERFLKNNKYYGYSIQRIMIEVFNVDEEDVKPAFKDMKEGLPTLYSKIRRALELLVKQNKLIKKKYSRAYFYYWKENNEC